MAALVFSPDGRWLYSSGWDGTVRAWFMADLSTPADELRGDIEAAWGRGLEAVLASGR
jgi:WD40 repeat protein